MLWKIVTGLLCAGSLMYYLALSFTLRRWNSTFSRFWLCGGILSGVLFVTVKDDRIQRILLSGILLFVAAILLTAGWIIRGTKPGKETAYEYLVVLGARVQGDRVTDSLARRLDRAAIYAKEHPKTVIIVSGGQGKGEDLPEAEAMEVYLIERGISRERILKECLSRTTEENLRFSGTLIEDLTRPVAVVSNDFHLYRAVSYAKKAGYQNVSPMAAGTKPVLFMNYLVRECFGVWKCVLR